MKWNSVPISSFCTTGSGGTPSRTLLSRYFDGHIPWVKSGELREDVIYDTEEYVTDTAVTESSVKMVPAGAILVAMYGATVGRIAMLGVSATTNQAVCHIVPDRELAEPKYLFYVLRAMVPEWLSRRVGGAQPNISQAIIRTTHVPLPSLPEQQRIVTILDKADAIRRKRAAAISLADNFLESAFLDMFGDPVTNPRGWPKKPLEKLLSFLTSGSRGWAKYYSDEGRPFLRIQNVGHNRLLMDDIAYVLPPDNAETRRTLVQPGDVLLSITADLGRTAVIPEGMAAAHINQHLALLRPQGIEPLYLSAFLSSPGGQTHIHALNRNGVKAGLNFSDVRSLEILLPPNSLQRCFVRVYERHTQMLQRLSKAMTTINALFESLVQRAFRGEL